jgi:thymidylate synthase (FAD)
MANRAAIYYNEMKIIREQVRLCAEQEVYMRIIEPKVEIITPINGQEILNHIEKVGRVCYKSEQNIAEGSAEKFVAGIVKRGHEAVIEHFNITVKFTTDRGITHEIVRHRIASYAQESTRYCNYSKDKFSNEIAVIRPVDIKEGTQEYEDWKEAMESAERFYFKLIEDGCKPQTARAVLPTCTKTELMVTMNLREWRHFIKLRAASAAHPDIRILALDLWKQFREQIPVIFDHIEIEE